MSVLELRCIWTAIFNRTEYSISNTVYNWIFNRIKSVDYRFLCLRIGETIELKCPFMVPRLNSDEYWNASMSVPGGLFLSGTVQVFQSCDLYQTGIEGMTSRALLWFSILTDFWLFSKWLLNSSLGYRNTYLCFYKPY